MSLDEGHIQKSKYVQSSTAPFESSVIIVYLFNIGPGQMRFPDLFGRKKSVDIGEEDQAICSPLYQPMQRNIYSLNALE